MTVQCLEMMSPKELFDHVEGKVRESGFEVDPAEFSNPRWCELADSIEETEEYPELVALLDLAWPIWDSFVWDSFGNQSSFYF